MRFLETWQEASRRLGKEAAIHCHDPIMLPKLTTCKLLFFRKQMFVDYLPFSVH